MHPVDWIVVVVFTAWIVYDGLKRTKDSHELEGYFLAKRSIPWWAAGISVMATQLSAITMIGTTGQAYADGMRFIQFYFALPLAMIILSVTLVPFFYNARVYTAYEFLEQRFDAKTRSFTSLLFLLSRGLSVGAVISAPAVVLSLVLGWNLTATALAISMPAVVYTMFGGVQAVTWTDVKTMTLIVAVCSRSSSRRSSACRTASASATGSRSRPPRAGCRPSTSRSICRTSTRSGPARSRRSSCSARTSARTRARFSAT